MADPTRFTGFADIRARFFSELALHNDRDWFQAHRAEYEEGWLRPMQALLAELAPLLARGYPGHRTGEPRVFRIHRDVRFSRDKSPFKTHIGGMLPVGGGRGGRSPVESPLAIYFHVSPTEDVFAGAGLYGMDPETLARHRAALLDRRGAEAARLVAALTRRGFQVESRERTRRPPRGIDPDHPRAALLCMKGLFATAPAVPRRLLVRRELVGHLAREVRAAAPLVRWLLRHVA